MHNCDCKTIEDGGPACPFIHSTSESFYWAAHATRAAHPQRPWPSVAVASLLRQLHAANKAAALAIPTASLPNGTVAHVNS
jgi:hypothetical protein